MGLVDGDAPRATTIDELEADPALPDARFADHAHDLPVRLECPGENAVQPGELLFPSHQAREAQHARRVEAGTKRADSEEREDPDRRADTLQGRRALVAQSEESLDQPRRVLAHIHRPGLSHLLHPRGEADGVPLGRVVHAQIVADRAHHHLSRVETHPHRELAPNGPEPTRVAPELVHQV